VTSYPNGSDADHQQFCLTEQWSEVKNARGGAVRHHYTYELKLEDGSVLRTRISRPVTNEQYGSSSWAHILRDQLCVTKESFWRCVNEKVLPPRPGAVEPDPKGGRAEIPAGIVEKLRRLVGLDWDEIAQMSPPEATARLERYWSEQGGL
jgi:hypothetical protein